MLTYRPVEKVHTYSQIFPTDPKKNGTIKKQIELEQSVQNNLATSTGRQIKGRSFEKQDNAEDSTYVPLATKQGTVLYFILFIL